MDGFAQLEQAAKGNTILGRPSSLNDVEFAIQGTNNVLFFEEGVSLEKTKVTISGSNSLIYFSTPCKELKASIMLGDSSTLYLGSDLFTHPERSMHVKVDDGATVVIGNDVLTSTHVVIDTLGKGNTLWIGDHVWLCQDAFVKGRSHIASNTIVAAKARLTNCTTEPFSCWGGKNRRLLTDVLYSKVGLRLLDSRQIALRESLPEREAQAIRDIRGFDRESLLRDLECARTAHDRLEIMRSAKHDACYHSMRTPLTKTPLMRLNSLVRSLRFGDGNQIVGDIDPAETRDSVAFLGKDNVLVVEPGVRLSTSAIKFTGSNGLLYLSSSVHPYRMFASISADSCCFFGHDCVFPTHGPVPRFVPSEGKAIVVGNRCVFENRAWARTSDQHGIYRMDTLERINPASPVVIGSDATVGKGCIIQKGATIAAGETVPPWKLVMRRKEQAHDTLSTYAHKLSGTTSMDERMSLAKGLSQILG